MLDPILPILGSHATRAGGARITPAGSTLLLDLDMRTPPFRFRKPIDAADFADEYGDAAVLPTSLNRFEVTSGNVPDDAGGGNVLAQGSTLLGRIARGLWNGIDWNTLLAGEVINNGNNWAPASNPTTTYNFDASTSFAGVLVWRAAYQAEATSGIVGKMNAANTSGWGIEVTNAGAATMKIGDATNSATRSPTGNLCDGAWHALLWYVDRLSGNLAFWTDLNQPAEVTLGSVGTLVNADAFRLGANRGLLCAPGQVALFAMFSTQAAVTAIRTAGTAGFLAWWAAQMTGAPTGVTYTRASQVGSIIGDGATGDQLTSFSPGSWVLRYSSSAASMGALAATAYTNIATHSDPGHTTGWTSVTCTATKAIGDCPRATKAAVRLLRTGAGGNRRHTVALVSGTTYTFSVWLLAVGAFVPQLRIKDAADAVLLADSGPIAASTTLWRRYSLTYTAAASANHIFEIQPGLPADATGDVWAQYAQIEAGSYAMPHLYTRAASATAAKTVVKYVAALATAERGELQVDATLLADADTVVRKLAAVTAVAATRQSGRELGYSATETMDAAVYDAAASLVATAATGVLAGAGSYHVATAQWDAAGVKGGTKEIKAARDDSATAEQDGTWAANVDAAAVYVGSDGAEGLQAQGVIHRLRLYSRPNAVI